MNESPLHNSTVNIDSMSAYDVLIELVRYFGYLPVIEAIEQIRQEQLVLQDANRPVIRSPRIGDPETMEAQRFPLYGP
jgi:hypothetical protein